MEGQYMSFKYPANGKCENTAIHKIVLKAIPYLLAQEDDDGERHEIAVLIKAARQQLFEGGNHALLISDGSFFSRARANTANFRAEGLPQEIRSNLNQDARVMANGMNEVDFVFEYYNPPGTCIRAVTEAKSGSAGSAVSQINNYTDALVNEFVNGRTGLAHEFYHCYESTTTDLDAETVGDMSRFFEALCGLNRGAGGGRGTIIDRARFFNPNGTVLGISNGKARMKRLLTHVRWAQQNPNANQVPQSLPVPGNIDNMNDTGLAGALNQEFFDPDCHFKIGVLQVKKTTRNIVGSQICSLITNNNLITEGKGDIWRRVYGILDARLKEL
jgi:hypothetical protein